MKAEEIFRNRLRTLRTERNLTQQQVSDAIGVTRIGFQNYEAGRRKPNFDAIVNLSRYFNVSADYLLGLRDVSA